MKFLRILSAVIAAGLMPVVVLPHPAYAVMCYSGGDGGAVCPTGPSSPWKVQGGIKAGSISGAGKFDSSTPGCTSSSPCANLLLAGDFNYKPAPTPTDPKNLAGYYWILNGTSGIYTVALGPKPCALGDDPATVMAACQLACNADLAFQLGYDGQLNLCQAGYP